MNTINQQSIGQSIMRVERTVAECENTFLISNLVLSHIVGQRKLVCWRSNDGGLGYKSRKNSNMNSENLICIELRRYQEYCKQAFLTCAIFELRHQSGGIVLTLPSFLVMKRQYKRYITMNFHCHYIVISLIQLKKSGRTILCRSGNSVITL